MLKPPRSFVIRALVPGDFGWVIERHGTLYAWEYGWDESFEALVAHIVADYTDKRDAKREAAWIAEVDGDRAGCVFCVGKNASTAQLQLMLVEPDFARHGNRHPAGRRVHSLCAPGWVQADDLVDQQCAGGRSPSLRTSWIRTYRRR